MNRSHRDEQQGGRRSTGRHRRTSGGPARERVHPVPLAPAGVPAAVPGAPPPSATVFVSDESCARYPWLPARVIVGSVWRSPTHQKVKVDATGTAKPWPPPLT